MSPLLAFAAAGFALAVVAVGRWFLRAVPAQRAEQAQLQVARARLTAGIARLGADVANLDPGSDPVARRRLAEAAERLATARAIFEHADTPEEALTVATTLVEGTRSANQVRVRLGLPKRRLPATRSLRELVRRTRRTRRTPREVPRWERRGRIALGMMLWSVGVGFAILWHGFLSEPTGPQDLSQPRDPVSPGRLVVAWLPFAAVAVVTLYAVLRLLLSAVHRSRADLELLAARRAEAEALVARIAARLAEPAAARAPDVELVTTEYVRAVRQLADARTAGDFRAVTDRLLALIRRAQVSP